MSRLEAIRTIVTKSPHDPFARYGLAMELKNVGQKEEAHQAFVELELLAPDYIAQYLMHGNLLLELERRDAARGVYERGIAVARKKPDAHALGELEQALAAL